MAIIYQENSKNAKIKRRDILINMLILYTKSGCSHCSLVKQELAKMDINYEERNVADPKNAESLIEQGGKGQTPFLIDEETGISMYESMAIIDYLKSMYGSS